jgi:hypothetical protein
MLQEFWPRMGTTNMQTASTKHVKRVGQLVAALASIAMLSAASFAAQDVSFVNTSGASLGTTQTVAAGAAITVVGRYTAASPQTANESGLGLKLLYDAAKLTPVVNSYSTKCAIAPPQIQANGATSKVVMGWIDTSIRSAGAVGWPGTADVASPNGCLEITGITQDDAAKTLPYDIFNVTFTTAAGYGSAAIQMVSDGNISYANTGNTDINKTLTLSSAGGGGLTLAGANPVVSRKTHGSAGTFDIPIDLTAAIGGAITVEPRQATTGASAQPHKIVYTFQSAPAGAGHSAVLNNSGGTAIGGASAVTSVVGNSIVVDLAGIGTNQRVNVVLTAAGGGGTFSAPVAFLLGDVTNTRSVSVADINAVRAVSGQTTTSSNFKADINVSGAISVGDINLVRSTSGSVLVP